MPTTTRRSAIRTGCTRASWTSPTSTRGPTSRVRGRRRSRARFDWQVSEGAVYGAPGTFAETGRRLQPIQPQVVGRPWFGAGPDRFLSALVRGFEADGGEFWTGSRARRLIAENGRVAGVVVATSDGLQDVHARSIVMADGGFQANRELMAQHITTDYLIDGSPLDTGDCLQMALEVGAKAVNMPWFYGHCRHRDSLFNARLSPHPRRAT